MIPNKNSGATVESNFGGAAYTAGIDAENMPFIIGLFTNLYSDPVRATVREYSTNAHDAQVEAGVKRPIEVTLPTAFAPFFKVKDYGIGLSEEDIKTVYSRYATSTKRGSNTQNGMLGLGCKSALAYADQFTVESVKDGMRTVCSISREGKLPVFRVLASIPDDSGNGTEVIVPARREDHQRFADRANEFYSFWPKGSILLNGSEPPKVEGLELGDGLLLVKHGSYQRRQDRIVMGNVPYPVEHDQMDLDLPNTYYAVIQVPIGSVEFTPSREGLEYSKLTKDTLHAAAGRVRKGITKAVQREVDQAKSPQAAIRAALDNQELIGKGIATSMFTFKGKQLPNKIDGRFIIAPYNARKQSQVDARDNGIDASYAARGLFVHGYTVTTFTAVHKRKLLQYAGEKNLDVGFFILSEAQPDTTWIDPDRLVTWDTIKAVELPKDSSYVRWHHGRPSGSYDAYIGSQTQHIQAEDIDQDEDIYYYQGNKYEARMYAKVIGDYDPLATFVCLPLNRMAKFQRNFPEAKTYRDGLNAAYAAWAAALTSEEREALTIYDESDPNALARMDESKIKDPKLKRAVKITKKIDASKLDDSRRTFQNVLHAIDTKSLTKKDWTCPLTPYKLVQYFPNYNIEVYRTEHFYIYANAAYSAGVNGKVA